MSRKTKKIARKRRADAWTIAAVAAAVVFVGAVAGIALTAGGGSEPAPAGAEAASAATEFTPTGEVSSMGLPVVETPGYTSGSAESGGVTVQGATWEMGQVPLDVAVLPFWTLTNTGASAVTLGEPQAEVRAGCCPGPFTLGARMLRPGESTVLTFELSMHEGMDGWHDMGVYVPVESTTGDGHLELAVTGDFRN
ncbi:MAG TPA: hypothetical protein VFK59_09575 [Actinomycetota bacterium]|nr:hypothetical protein [Actinomycetota bacterium]